VAVIWVISDTHFNHNNILKFTRKDGSLLRDFKSIEAMNEYIITQWNRVVVPGDHVYHLGDVGDADIIHQLNGKKRLILGNHDQVKNRDVWNAFQKIQESRIFREYNCILTHRPILIPEQPCNFKWNVHGHIHYHNPPTASHINVSVERTGYKPVRLDRLVEEHEHKHKRRVYESKLPELSGVGDHDVTRETSAVDLPVLWGRRYTGQDVTPSSL
jgi:calcineurin-like phosphoesterase family protein